MKISMSKGRLLAILALLLGCALLWRGFFEPGRQRGMPPSSTSYFLIIAIIALSKLPSSS